MYSGRNNAENGFGFDPIYFQILAALSQLAQQRELSKSAQQQDLHNRIENLQQHPAILQMNLETKFNFCFWLFQTLVTEQVLQLRNEDFVNFLEAVQKVFNLTIEDQNHFLALFREKIKENYVNQQ